MQKNKKVSFYTKSGMFYRGILRDFDENGNFYVEAATENNREAAEKIGDVVINGINIALLDISE